MKEARYLMERLVAPAGRKISLKDYMRAYEDAFSHTSTKHAPWYIIPADNKWFMRLAVAAIMHQTLQDLDLRYPNRLEGEEGRASTGSGFVAGGERLTQPFRSQS
jgi:Polyphosphate kinase 2 (PPK2)